MSTNLEVFSLCVTGKGSQITLFRNGLTLYLRRCYRYGITDVIEAILFQTDFHTTVSVVTEKLATQPFT